jgi:hypothetical protein
VIRSALLRDLGVDYGDVVLFDGAPVTHHVYGERRVPVFPHLVTLERPGYRVFPFAGTQKVAHAITELSHALPGDAILYSHTEQLVIMCSHCWQSDTLDHGAHQRDEHQLVRGKLCAPPSISPKELLRAVDAAVAAVQGVRLFVPELCAIAGDRARAEVEVRRMKMLEGP